MGLAGAAGCGPAEPTPAWPLPCVRVGGVRPAPAGGRGAGPGGRGAPARCRSRAPSAAALGRRWVRAWPGLAWPGRGGPEPRPEAAARAGPGGAELR